jgi:hypothetical protein
MKLYFEERPHGWTLRLVGLSCAVLVAGCERQQTMASKSAAAYDEAVAKGLTIGSGHGGHEATGHEGRADMEMSGATETGEASRMAGTTHHPQAASAGSARAQMDHDQMGHSAPAGTAEPAMAGMNHGALAHSAGAGHPRAAPAPALPLETPDSSAEMARLAPAETLQQDELDTPAALSLAEARKARSEAGHTGHGAQGAGEQAPAQPPSQEHRHEPPPPEALR